METRARAAQSVAVAGILFRGSSGSPFLWDGSDRSDIVTPAAILAYPHYDATVALVAATGSAAEGMDAGFSSEETWMHLDMTFVALERVYQAFVLLGCSVNICLGLWQIKRFYRADILIELVLAIEVLSQVCLLIFVIDGPFMEHTHYSVMPWIADRMMQMFAPQLHSIATFLVALQLRTIILKIETPALSVGAGDSVFRTLVSCAYRFRYHFFACAIALSVLADFVISILTGLFIGDLFYGVFMSAYVALVSLFVGALFMVQGLFIRRKLIQTSKAAGRENPRVMTFSHMVRLPLPLSACRHRLVDCAAPHRMTTPLALL